MSSAGNLEPVEYNAIVEAFAEVVTGIFGSRVTVTLGPDRQSTLAERLGMEPMRLLEEYEGCANRDTGGAHPLDRARWNRFVIACHRAGVGEPEDVRAFLTERGWAERHVEAHADRFEYGRSYIRARRCCTPAMRSPGCFGSSRVAGSASTWFRPTARSADITWSAPADDSAVRRALSRLDLGI